MIRNIAIIGATGMLGKPVTEELRKAGFHMTLFARNTAGYIKRFEIKNDE